MRTINISNEKARNAQVGFEQKREKSDIAMVRPDGAGFANARFLKSTIDTEAEDLLRMYGTAEAVAEEIINADPEIDFEKVGMQLKSVKKVYLTADDKIAFRINRQEAVFTPAGEEKEVRRFEGTESNINLEIPLRWTGKLIPKSQAVRKFVFTHQYQLCHVNGLTYDFLYEMAKQLSDKDSLMLIGGGPKGVGPLYFSGGGTPYRAFLEGRVDGDRYCLIIHLTNLELKTI